MPSPRDYSLVDEDLQDELARAVAVERSGGRGVHDRARYLLKRSGPFVDLVGVQKGGERVVWYSGEHKFVSSADIEKTEATRNRREVASGPDALAEAVAQVEPA